MEIQKVFSDYYDTERMYSVLMSEDELRLFALRDYAGLTKQGQKVLRKQRNEAAREIMEQRRMIMDGIEMAKNPKNVEMWNKLPDSEKYLTLTNGGLTRDFNPNWSAREAAEKTYEDFRSSVLEAYPTFVKDSRASVLKDHAVKNSKGKANSSANNSNGKGKGKGKGKGNSSANNSNEEAESNSGMGLGLGLGLVGLGTGLGYLVTRNKYKDR